VLTIRQKINAGQEARTANRRLAKKRVQYLNEALCFVSSSVLADSLVLRNPLLRQAPNRCTKGSLRSPSVQRGAAAPLLHEVLPTVAHRTTTVLQN